MEEAPNIGVVNPYALAEIVLQRPISWDRVARPETLMAETLQTPYEQLFDLANEGPLFPGIKQIDEFEVRRLEPDDAVKSIEDLRIPGVRLTDTLNRYMTITPETVRMRLTETVTSPLATTDQPWNPANTEWIDKGDFFEEAAEAGDAKQGALADCYHIAALASVAWAMPKIISQRTRRVGSGQQEFMDSIKYYGTPGDADVEVTEKVPVIAGSHSFKYARSTENGEVWPAIYEKAYAKWKTGTATDQPDYATINYGDPVRACAEIINGSRHYKGTTSTSAEDLWQYVRTHSLSYRTFDPMVAWTFGSSPAGTNYAAAKVVGNHAYSVLGWDYAAGEKYIVLRNPWATHSATLDVLGGSWNSYDISYWRYMPLNTNGVFSMKAATFKAYFAGIGHSET